MCFDNSIARYVYLFLNQVAIEHNKRNRRDSNQISLSDKDQQVGLLVASCAPWGRAKFAIYDFLLQQETAGGNID